MGRKKIELIHLFTEMGLDILVSDVDTAAAAEPDAVCREISQADVLTSSDHLSNTAVGDGLEDPRKARSAANIGIMLLRHTAKDLAKEWVEVLEKDDKIWDQNAFNDLYRAGGSASVKDEDNVVTGYHGKLKIGILPVATFASGHTYSCRGCTRWSAATLTSSTRDVSVLGDGRQAAPPERGARVGRPSGVLRPSRRAPGVRRRRSERTVG